MKQKYLNSIELFKIVEMAKELAVCPETKVLLDNEVPFTDTEDVRHLLLQTDCIAKKLLKNAAPRISSCEGANFAANRAEKGGVLSMTELLYVGAALRNFAALDAWFKNTNNEDMAAYTPVDDLFFTIAPQPALERAIFDAILSDTEIADTASDELYTLRKKIRIAESSIREKLDAVVKNPNNAKYLQDALVSIRNGRFVVPVKAENRGEIAGVVHDVSQSGGTFFVEPASVVEANAKIMQLRSAEKAEIERILQDFSGRVADVAPYFESSWHAMLEIDKRLAKATLGLSMNGILPKVNQDMAFSLVKARHPLIDKKICVPVDIELGKSYNTLVVTGPNTGGKTVCLKTAGLFCAMAQLGFLLPAHDSTEICVFESILVDIGDEQSIEQSLSTFSGHISNIRGILETVNCQSLVLLDELGAGTDPAEGAALAIAIIENIGKTGALVMATTHYAELKMFALDTKGVQNAGSEFNVETLRPTYRLIVGVPGRSNAFLIGEKLGIPKEVIEDAKGHMSGEQRRFEAVLSQLEDLKLEFKAQEEEIEALRHAADNKLKLAQKKCDELVQQGQNELMEAQNRAKDIAENVQNTAFALMDEMRELQKNQRLSEAQKAQRARQIAKNEAEILNKKAREGMPAAPKHFVALTAATPGQEVWIPDMNRGATVISAPKSGMVELRIGALKTKLPLAELCEKSKNSPKNAKRGVTSVIGREDVGARSVKTELNLLGKTVEEALMEVDQFIDMAAMGGLSTLYIIHGRGTGALKKAISQHLKTIKIVKSYRLGRYGEGEDGVTVVEI